MRSKKQLLQSKFKALRDRRDWLARDGRLMRDARSNGFDRVQYLALHWAILELTEKYPEFADPADAEVNITFASDMKQQQGGAE